MKLRGHMGGGEGTSRCMVEGRCHASRLSAMDRQYIVAWQAWKSRLRADGAQLHDWGGVVQVCPAQFLAPGVSSERQHLLHDAQG